jgi:hypothetical protein
MSACDENCVRILRYLENSLRGEELADFLDHLEHCSNCRDNLEKERSLSQLLHRSRPLYSAPLALRSRVAAAVERHANPAIAHVDLYERVVRVMKSGFEDPARRIARLRLLAATLAVLAMLFAFGPNLMRNVRAANYVETAVATHRSYVEGDLPLGLRSNSPEQVTAWFNGKLPFPFRLPRAQAVPDTVPAYRLTGASLVKYRGKAAALVTYQKQNEKISLLVASAGSAVVAGGDEVRSGKLTFHYRTDQGFNVVTWNNHDLSYALVSSVSGSARESCMVCHESTADHQNNFNAGHK